MVKGFDVANLNLSFSIVDYQDFYICTVHVQFIQMRELMCTSYTDMWDSNDKIVSYFLYKLKALKVQERQENHVTLTYVVPPHF